MNTLKNLMLNIYYEVKYFVPNTKVAIKRWIISKLMKSEYSSLEESHLQEHYYSINNCGSDYNYAMFFPVRAIQLCLFNVFNTNLIPLMGVETNINEINPETDKLVVKIYTTRPGMFIGKGGETMDKIYVELKKMFHCSNVDVDLNEVENIHTVAEY